MVLWRVQSCVTCIPSASPACARDCHRIALASGRAARRRSRRRRPRPAATGAQSPRITTRSPTGIRIFQGFYDVATMTPVERPAGVDEPGADARGSGGDGEVRGERQVKNDAPLAGDRTAPPVGGETTHRQVVSRISRTARRRRRRRLQQLLARRRHAGDQGRRPDAQLADHRSAGRQGAADEAGSAEAKRGVRCAAARSRPTPAKAAAAGPPGAFDGPELRPLAERCLLGFGSTSGPPTLPNYFYNNMKQIVQTKDTDPDPERDGARRPRHPHERRAPAADHPQVDGRFGRPLGRRHAGRRHHQLHEQDAVPRLGREPARRRALHAHRRRTRCSIGSRSTIRRRGIGRGPASIRGTRPTRTSTSTRATKATTRSAACCAARVRRKRRRREEEQQ